MTPYPGALYGVQVALGKAHGAQVLCEQRASTNNTIQEGYSWGKERQEENLRIVMTHALWLAWLIHRHLLRRRAFLVEDVIQAYTN